MMFLIVALFFALSFAGEGPVSYYGELKASGNILVGSKTGETPVQVRGVSFGWSNTTWESGRFYTAVAVEHMVKDWNAEIIRSAYGETGQAFTSTTAASNRKSIETVVDAALANDVYAVIDWHSHAAQNEVQNSKDYFEYMAQKYGSYDNVIFEIYNEPTSPATWATIKTYAEQIIPVIRQYSDNLILVGTPNYSQKIQDVVGNAINDPNLGYVVHFYAYSHPVATFSENMNKALDANLPIFVTEYGTTHADGGLSTSNPSHYDTHSAANTDAWHAFMDEKKISSCAWSINDKQEGAAFFGIPGAAKKFDMNGSWTDESKMTESGKYVFNKLNMYAETAPWRIAGPPDPPDPPDPTPILNPANLPSFGQANAIVYSLSGKKIGKLTEVNLQNGVYILISKQNGIMQKKIVRVVK